MAMSAEARKIRTRVGVREDHVTNVASSDFPGAYAGIDDSWNYERFKENFRIEIIRESEDGMELEFDMIGVDAAIANTFRRILIAEVPTMAIEHCFVFNNTSVIADELLCHRLGLIPLKIDARLFAWLETDSEGGHTRTDQDTLVFSLQVECTKNPNCPANATAPSDLYINSSVYSGDLRWSPQGSQQENYGDIRPVHEDILIAKLRPGQKLDITLHAVKGTGKQHAKWSPVGTASYRIMPEIVLKEEIRGDLARELQGCFAEGVIALDDTPDGDVVARVANPRLCTMSREVLRHPALADKVELNRIRDHFIFSVESTGALKARELVRDAVIILGEKCKLVKTELDQLPDQEDEEEGDEEQPDNVEGMEVEE
eukprot:m.11467 g.11467  ORF g.11467 m.11467 type:complete len:372 (-) comp3158_c0_seq1:2372-3487(-)